MEKVEFEQPRRFGDVVHLRITPTELRVCMSVLRAAEVDMEGMSLSQIVRRALSVMCYTLEGDIPARKMVDEHEAVRLRQRALQRGQVVKLHREAQVSREIYDRAKLDLPTAPQIETVRSDARRRLEPMIQEARFKNEQDPDNMSIEQWILLVRWDGMPLEVVPDTARGKVVEMIREKEHSL